MKQKINHFKAGLIAVTLIFLGGSAIAQNTFPNTGNVGVGTTSPTAGLDVNRHMKIDSTLTVKDSVRLKSKLTVDQKAVFKQNVVVRGQLLRAYHNAKINNNLVVDNKLTVDGVTKLNGVVKMPNLQIPNQNDLDSGLYEVVIKMPNGKLKTIPVQMFVENQPQPLYSTNPCADLTTNGFWTYSPNSIWTKCTNVGINVDNPQAELEVDGRVHSKIFSAGYYFNNPTFWVTGNGVTIRAQAGNVANRSPLVVYDFNNNKLFQVQNDGLVRAKEVKVDLDYANWPDYVFEKDYKMISLEQIAKYIVKYKHLPGVPSAQKIKTEGLSLGKMQTILMQKIEELTLYAINQNTQIKDLEKNVTTLEKENKQLKSDLQQVNDRLDKIEAMLNHK